MIEELNYGKSASTSNFPPYLLDSQFSKEKTVLWAMEHFYRIPNSYSTHIRHSHYPEYRQMDLIEVSSSQLQGRFLLFFQVL